MIKIKIKNEKISCCRCLKCNCLLYYLLFSGSVWIQTFIVSYCLTSDLWTGRSFPLNWTQLLWATRTPPGLDCSPSETGGHSVCRDTRVCRVRIYQASQSKLIVTKAQLPLVGLGKTPPPHVAVEVSIMRERFVIFRTKS